MLKGVVHVHSTFSDGEFTLAELRTAFLASGCAFVCITDHAEFFEASDLDKYRMQCAALSDYRFCFVPGLEFRCEQGMHILGYGVTSPVETEDPQEVIQHIEANGGIAVIAHPKETAFEWINSFSTLPAGIEVWNSKYDGRYAPRPGTFQLLARLQERRPDMRAFYGQDLHWKKQYRRLFNLVDCRARVPKYILNAFRYGQYSASKGELKLPSNGRLPQPALDRFECLHARSDQLRRCIRTAKKLADDIGVAIPAHLKSQLRRMI